MNKLETFKREKLQREKPLVYEKILQIVDREKRGELVCRIDIGYNYACNLKCLHCMANSFQKKERSLTIDDLHNIAEQADALGWCQFNISGGEPLILKNFDDVLKALMPDRFHIGISTNGYFLTKEKAKHLKSLGLDKVMISIDSINPILHNKNRADDEAYKKAMDAVWAAKEADLDVILQHVVTHQNCQSDNTVMLAKFASKNGFSLDLIVAKALGEWEGKHEVLIDEEDAKFLRRLHAFYPEARRDVFPSYGRGGGCPVFKKCFHITEYGDVLVCVFIHISLGNIFKDTLKTIVDRGMNIKPINKSQALCRAGEDREFIDKYMSRFYGKPLPVDYKEIFDKEDYEVQPIE
jgi:MoaA/NifB/PqqE/SkfB family radical SAM enzyme